MEHKFKQCIIHEAKSTRFEAKITKQPPKAFINIAKLVLFCCIIDFKEYFAYAF